MIKSNLKNSYKIFFTGVLTLMLALSVLQPALVSAQSSQNPDETGIVPCGNAKDASGRIIKECTFYDFIKLINNLINKLILISFPVAAAVIAYAGFIIMTHPASSGDRKKAQDMITKVFIGFAIIISAWLIVGALAGSILKSEFKDVVPVQGV